MRDREIGREKHKPRYMNKSSLNAKFSFLCICRHITFNINTI